MGSSILSIGATALNAAQVGVATTGHNISNAATPGYSRQVVLQASAGSQNSGFAFVGKGTEVTGISRVYNQFLTNQVLTAQTSSSQLSTYNTRITQVDNLLANPAAGLSPALQDFFSSVQTASTDPNSAASRQALLSSSDSLASRFQGQSTQISEVRDGVNGQIGASISNINTYAGQIARLNDAIEKAQAGTDNSANDLLDQRDQAVLQLSKEVKVSVVQQGDSYNVFIGSGQPLVVGTKTSTLYATSSLTDPTRTEVGVRSSSGATTLLDEKNLPGGNLGGLFDFRSTTLDVAQNTLGRVATNLASVFNAQHALGQTQTGAAGGNFFNAAVPDVQASSLNATASTGKVATTISDPSKLTISDYRVQVVAPVSPSSATVAYKVTRLSDGVNNTFNASTTAGAATGFTVDGVDYAISGASAIGDEFKVRPTANGAAGFSVAVTDKADIALGAPIATTTSSTNSGTGAIGPATVNSTAVIPGGLSLTYNAAAGKLTGFPANQAVTITNGSPATTVTFAAGAAVAYDPTSPAAISIGTGASSVALQLAAVTPPTTAPTTVNVPSPNATLTYNGTLKTLSGFPSPLAVTVTIKGVSTTYAPGAAVPFTAGATLSFGGINVAFSGVPANGDTFKVGPNTNGLGDNRNALLLGKLQTANTLDGGTTNLQAAYSQLVSSVGSKAHEVQATSTAAASLLEQSVASQQSESGVNLDEEAANLLRYQQAYQAAGKLMQTASTLFSVLLSLGSN